MSTRRRSAFVTAIAVVVVFAAVIAASSIFGDVMFATT